MGSIWNIPNSSHLSSELIEHLKYYIAFKCPIANSIRFNSKIQDGLELCASFLTGVFTFIRNDECFQRTFWGLWKDLSLNLVEFHLLLGFIIPHFKFLENNRMHDAHWCNYLQTILGLWQLGLQQWLRSGRRVGNKILHHPQKVRTEHSSATGRLPGIGF